MERAAQFAGLGNRIVEKENCDFVSGGVAHAASAVWRVGDGGE
jgi:hypothetical protein